MYLQLSSIDGGCFLHPQAEDTPCSDVKELVIYQKNYHNMLNLVGVQVRWEGGGTEPAGEYTFL
jgi:hypothetical protein